MTILGRQTLDIDASKPPAAKRIQLLENGDAELEFVFTGKSFPVGSVAVWGYGPADDSFRQEVELTTTEESDTILITVPQAKLATSGTFRWDLRVTESALTIAWVYGAFKLVHQAGGDGNPFDPSIEIDWQKYTYDNTTLEGPYIEGVGISFGTPNADGQVAINLTGGAGGNIEDSTTAETDTTKIIQPDGVGGVAWVADTGGGGHTIEDEGTPLTQRTSLNFIGASITATDNAGTDATDVTIDVSDKASATDLTDHEAETGANAVHGSTDANTANAIVARDANGVTILSGLQLDTAASPGDSVGQIRWNDTDKCIEYNTENGTTIQVGQELGVYARNSTGSTIDNGAACYVSGATGNRPTVALANADAELTADTTIGLCTGSAGILNNGDGFITTFGLVRGLNTLGLTEGNDIYLSDSVAGTWTQTEPTADASYVVRLGVVTRAHATLGEILVNVTSRGTAIAEALRHAGTKADGRLAIEAAASHVESTGVLTGGVLSTGAGAAQFSITDGTGVIADAAGNLTNVSWTGKTNITPTNIASDLLTWVAIDSNGDVLEKTTPFTSSEARANIILGVIVHVNNTTVDAVNNEQVVASNPLSTTYDVAEALGFVNISGNVYGPSGAALTFQKSAGVMFKIGSNYDVDATNPHNKTLATVDTAAGGVFQYRFSDGTSGPATDTLIDPDNLDDGAGGTTAVGNNRWSVQRIYSFVSNNVKIQRGVEDFATKSAAIDGYLGEAYTTEPSIAANALLRGWLVVKKGATDLSDTAEAEFLAAPKFGEGTAGGTSAPAGDSADLILPARKATAGTIGVGVPVRSVGWDGTRTLVEVADADAAGGMPSIGITRSSMTDSVTGTIVFAGTLEGIDTSAFSIGDALYVSDTPGTLTNTKPTSLGSAIQAVGRVLSVDAVAGVIQIVGAGRANDIPYFTAADKMWYGTTNGVSTETDVTAFARTLLDDADAATARTTLGITAESTPTVITSSGGAITIDPVNGNIQSWTMTENTTVTVSGFTSSDFGEITVLIFDSDLYTTTFPANFWIGADPDLSGGEGLIEVISTVGATSGKGAYLDLT